jgi:hypothetical protein
MHSINDGSTIPALSILADTDLGSGLRALFGQRDDGDGSRERQPVLLGLRGYFSDGQVGLLEWRTADLGRSFVEFHDSFWRGQRCRDIAGKIDLIADRAWVLNVTAGEMAKRLYRACDNEDICNEFARKYGHRVKYLDVLGWPAPTAPEDLFWFAREGEADDREIKALFELGQFTYEHGKRPGFERIPGETAAGQRPMSSEETIEEEVLSFIEPCVVAGESPERVEFRAGVLLDKLIELAYSAATGASGEHRECIVREMVRVAESLAEPGPLIEDEKRCEICGDLLD